MIAIRLYDYDTIVRLLNPYGCRRLEQDPSGFEMWITGWGEHFTLKPSGHRYDSWQFDTVISKIIAKTMPPEWEVITTPPVAE